MNDTWETIEAEQAEKFVDEGYKAITQVIRKFKEWDKQEGKDNYKPLLEMVDGIKKNIEDFRVNVPLLVSLKQEGMEERHWEEIHQKSGIKVEINDHTNF